MRETSPCQNTRCKTNSNETPFRETATKASLRLQIPNPRRAMSGGSRRLETVKAWTRPEAASRLGYRSALKRS
jgi:hypothetical protein